MTDELTVEIARKRLLNHFSVLRNNILGALPKGHEYDADQLSKQGLKPLIILGEKIANSPEMIKEAAECLIIEGKALSKSDFFSSFRRCLEEAEGALDTVA